MHDNDYKALPHSEESERVILGAILLDNSLFSKVSELLQRNDFYSELHRKIFISMKRISDSGKSIDPIIIYEELKKTEFGASFSVADITSLTYGLPYLSDISHYADIFKGLFIKT
jgi:replicative DNA helicase